MSILKRFIQGGVSDIATDVLRRQDIGEHQYLATLPIPATGGWQTWTTATATLTLPAGQPVLTLVQDTGGWNLNSLQFTQGGGTPTPVNLAAGRPTTESSHTQVYSSANLTDGNQGSSPSPRRRSGTGG